MNFRYLLRSVVVFSICTLLLGGCSFYNRFIIYNQTKHDLLIRYKLNSSSKDGFFSQNVVAYKTKSGNCAADTCIFDPQTGIVELQLRKAHHVVIGGGFCTTYQFIKNTNSVFATDHFRQFNNLDYLEITSGDEWFRYQGDSLETLIAKSNLGITRIDIKKL